MKNQKGFGFIALVLVVAAMVGLAAGGYIVYMSRTQSSRPLPIKAPAKPVKEISKQNALDKLHDAFISYTSKSQEDCPYFKNSCLEGSLASSDKVPIEEALGIESDPDGSNYFGLERGNAIDVGG